MKHNNINILLVILMIMIGNKAFGYDIAVKNKDGVTLYYNYINEGKELEVTYREINAWDEYEGTRAETINIPATVTYNNRKREVTKIGDYSFSYGYTRYTSNYTTNKVTIPNTVREIGKSVFYNCKVLRFITIPNSVQKIGTQSFLGCENLNVYISDIASWCTIEFAPEYQWSGPGGSNPLEYAKKLYLNGEELTNLIIPDGVKNIGKYAFYKCSFLKAVTFQNSVTSIGVSAFEDCTNLTEVNIPDLASWCNIEFGNISSNPLYYAHNLFLNNSNKRIQILEIPNSVTIIKKYTFSGCSCISFITIPNSVTEIGYGAFSGCYKLTSIDIPNSVTTIKSSTFSGCSSLISITIPNSVTSIGDWAFSSSGLKTFTIPNSVTHIGYGAFQDCKHLYTIISLIEIPFELDNDPFDNDQYMNSSLYIPVGTIDKYKTTKGWKKFVWIEESPATNIKEDKILDDEITCYSLDGVKLESAKKGINIIRHANGKTSKVLIK